MRSHLSNAPARFSRRVRAVAASLAVLASAVLAASSAEAGSITITYGAPVRAGDVTTSIKAGGVGLTDSKAPITGNDTATDKRDLILARINLQIAIDPVTYAGWSAQGVGAAGLKVTTPGKPTAKVDPGKTGEKDAIAAAVGAGEGLQGQIDFFASSYDASSGAAFTAGLFNGSSSYEVSLTATDLGFTPTGAEIASLMYDRLTAIVPTGFATLSYTTGSTFFDIFFTSPTLGEETGITFANTSTTDGLTGSLSVVPEPASLALLALGLAGGAVLARRRPRSPRG